MLILLPPSEGKTRPEDGPPFRLDLRPDPLQAPTSEVMAALRTLCTSEPARALRALGLTPRQIEWLEFDAELADAPTAPAHEVYSGVLYQALDYPSLTRAAATRADEQVWVASALYGMVRLGDPIAAYRLSGGTKLPGLPSESQLWQEPIQAVMDAHDPDVILDLRSGAYTSLWRPPKAWRDRVVVGKVWQLDPSGRRTSVSHHNKATKGLLTRELMRQSRKISTPRALHGAARRAGEVHNWTAESSPGRLDIVLHAPG